MFLSTTTYIHVLLSRSLLDSYQKAVQTSGTLLSEAYYWLIFPIPLICFFTHHKCEGNHVYIFLWYNSFKVITSKSLHIAWLLFPPIGHIIFYMNLWHNMLVLSSVVVEYLSWFHILAIAKDIQKSIGIHISLQCNFLCACLRVNMAYKEIGEWVKEISILIFMEKFPSFAWKTGLDDIHKNCKWGFQG